MADNDSSPNDPQDLSARHEDDGSLWALLPDKDRHAIWERLLKAAPRGSRGGKAAEPEPLTPFDRTFQREVPARLETVLRLSASLLHWDLESFSDAHARVMRQARRRGAAHLSDTAFCALDDWVSQQLLKLVDETPPDYLISPKRLAKLSGEPRS